MKRSTFAPHVWLACIWLDAVELAFVCALCNVELKYCDWDLNTLAFQLPLATIKSYSRSSQKPEIWKRKYYLSAENLLQVSGERPCSVRMLSRFNSIPIYKVIVLLQCLSQVIFYERAGTNH